MATACKIYLSSPLRDVQHALDGKLGPGSLSLPPGFDDFFEAGFGHSRPTCFMLVGDFDESLCEIIFNNFDGYGGLCSFLSDRFGGCLVNLCQSVSDAFGWRLYREGELIRALTVADGELHKELGPELPFEKEQLVQLGIEWPEIDWFEFDIEDIVKYNNFAGYDADPRVSSGSVCVYYQLKE